MGANKILLSLLFASWNISFSRDGGSKHCKMGGGNAPPPQPPPQLRHCLPFRIGAHFTFSSNLASFFFNILTLQSLIYLIQWFRLLFRIFSFWSISSAVYSRKLILSWLIFIIKTRFMFVCLCVCPVCIKVIGEYKILKMLDISYLRCLSRK